MIRKLWTVCFFENIAGEIIEKIIFKKKIMVMILKMR
jgi:hypothetical protein